MLVYGSLVTRPFPPPIFDRLQYVIDYSDTKAIHWHDCSFLMLTLNVPLYVSVPMPHVQESGHKQGIKSTKLTT